MNGLDPHADGVLLSIRARAGARSNGLQLGADGLLKVSVTRAPERGKANQAIIELLSRRLRLKKSHIELVAGPTSPQKRFLISGTSLSELQARIDQIIR